MPAGYSRERIDNFRSCGARGSHHRRTYICPRVVVGANTHKQGHNGGRWTNWRQELYKEFIAAASKCYINALQCDQADVPALVELYVRVGRMRSLSSTKVVESAAFVARRIIVISARPAARNWSRFMLNSETRYELKNCPVVASVAAVRDLVRVRAEQNFFFDGDLHLLSEHRSTTNYL